MKKPNTPKPCPDREYLRKTFSYREDGNLIWLERPVKGRCSIFFGKVAGSKITKHDRYKKVSLDGDEYKLHRLIWTWHFGQIPDGLEIDHRDGDRDNNRIANFRPTDRFGQSHNTGKKKNNKSGTTGVWTTRSGKWVAAVTYNGRRHHLGTHDAVETAALAVSNFRKDLDFSHRHGV